MHATPTAMKITCFCASGLLSAQMLHTPSAASTLTATSTGQFVAIASCCQSRFIVRELGNPVRASVMVSPDVVKRAAVKLAIIKLGDDGPLRLVVKRDHVEH